MRPLEPADLDELVALDSDPEVMRHITGGQPTPRAVVEQTLLDRMLPHADPARGRGYFAIVETSSERPRFLGWAHLRPDRVQPSWLEVGYRLHRRWWGLGIASWAAARLVTRGLADPDVPVISARTTTDNHASRRVMEKLGMRLAGTFVFPEAQLGEMTIAAASAVLYRLDRESPA